MEVRVFFVNKKYKYMFREERKHSEREKKTKRKERLISRKREHILEE